MIMNALSAALLTLLLADPATPATKPGEKTFDTAQQAADALVQAVAKDDTAALNEIFGSSGQKIVSSGDDVEDKNNRARFTELAKTKTDVVVDKKNAHRAILSLGGDGWPFPVPIVQTGAKWHFDSKSGLREILYRRVGQNELDAIQICLGYVEAQQEYASQAREIAGFHMYAQKILSTPGKKDGLAWYDADGKPAGPIGEQVAKALEEGYKDRTKPYHGYFFKVLMAQGPAAPPGARDYVLQGKMIGGFALVAWPAEYRASGVKTFIVNNDGIVYEKDLGANTGKVAAAMKAYNPDKSWSKVPESAE
jgi:hypothetical protein